MRFILFLLLAGCAAAPRAAPAPDWEARFRRPESAWRGGDAVYSVRLSDDRVLWLFGDSFVASPGSAGRQKVVMVRNSLAVQKLPGDPEFFWRTTGGRPDDAFPKPKPDEWLWPLSGQRAGPALLLFKSRLRAQGTGAFGFAATGNLLVSVPNPDEPPASWRIESRELPFFARGATFGAASILHEGHLYVYGLRKRSLLVARVPADEAGDPAQWLFFDGDSWSPDVGSARPLFGGAATEMTVCRWGRGFVAVYSAPFLSPDILLRRSPRPEGPWGPAEVVYRCPDAAWKKGYFCYAAKAHPEISGDEALLLSYACNSFDFGDLFGDLRVYWPRFVRLTP